MKKKSAIREFIKKIPFTISLYIWVTETLPFLFYRKPEVLSVQGSKMYLNVWEPDKSIRRTFRAYATDMIHEPRTTQIFKEILRPGNVFIDLGANIGYFSLLASQLVGPSGKVNSFEPEPRNFKYLCKNSELNNYTQMEAFNMAVSNKRGTVKLYVCPYDTGHHTIQQSEGITSYSTERPYDPDKLTSVDIETVPLDEFFLEKGISHIDFIKMDVEGAELLALQGMKNTLKNNDKVIMIAEFFPLLIEKMGSDPSEVLRLLTEEYGFHLYRISDDYSADIEVNSATFTRITDLEPLIQSYEKDKMYHINIFAIKPNNQEYKSIVDTRI